MNDIVERLRDRAYSGKATDALCDQAADEIVRLRGALMELGACVRMAEAIEEAVESANKLSPVSVNAALLQGFHSVDMAWRNVDKDTGPAFVSKGDGRTARTEEPVAWAVLAKDIGATASPCSTFMEAKRLAARSKDCLAAIVPLYRQPQPTLTDAEREAIGNVLHHIATRADHLQREAHDLRGLLERLK